MVSCILLNILASIYRFESFTWIPVQILYIHGHFKLRNMKLTHWAWAACDKICNQVADFECLVALLTSYLLNCLCLLSFPIIRIPIASRGQNVPYSKFLAACFPLRSPARPDDESSPRVRPYSIVSSALSPPRKTTVYIIPYYFSLFC